MSHKEEELSQDEPDVVIGIESPGGYCAEFLDRLNTNIELGRDIEKCYVTLEEFEVCKCER